MRRLLWLVLAILLAVAANPANAAGILADKNLLMPEYTSDWQTLSSPHFNIHFESGYKIQAQQVAAIAERVHARLSPWLGWQPLEPTEVVLLDTVDTSNGMANPLPYNHITIYMQSPADGELMDQLPWLETVITHEYVHILHLDMAEGMPQAVRGVFGRSTDIFTLFDFPQLFAPTWVTEGLAVYGESTMAGQHGNSARYGRLNGALYDGLMRMEVLRGLYGMTEVSYNAGFRWPYGQQYLYGAYFFRFVEARYGKDAVAGYIRVYGGNVIPFRMDKRSYQIFGQSADEVWAAFQRYLQDYFAPQIAAIRQQPARTRVVFAEPYTEYALSAGKAGELYFVHDDQSSGPMVRRLNADGSVDFMLDGRGVQEIDAHAEAGLLLNKWTVCDNTNIYTDLYVWKAGMSSAQRITHCGRYLFAAWRPDGKAIAAVQAVQGGSRLVLLDTDGNLLQVLAELNGSETLGQIGWSPDGTAIVASVRRRHAGWNLALLNVADRQWQVLVHSGDLVQRPRFAADGKSVYFLSDHGKAWNLRRMTTGSKQVETLSNSLSVIADAQEMPDNSFRLLEYTGQGTEIVALDAAGANSLPHYAAYDGSLPAVDAISDAADFKVDTGADSKPYSPWHTLKPRAWFPLVDSSAGEASYAGILIQGADALDFHRWQALPLYYYDLKTWGGLANYNFYNTLTLAAENRYYMLDNAASTIRYRDREERYQLLLQHYFNTLDDNWYLAAGMADETIAMQVYSGSGADLLYRNRLQGGIVQYDSTRIYKRSISPVDGRRVQLLDEAYDPQSDFSGNTTRAEWHEFFALGGNHVLHFRGVRGEGASGIRPYRLGGVSETLSQIGGPTGLGRRDFPLRGYPVGLAGLTGSNFALASVEWRMPLGYHYDGWMAPPIGAGRESLTLFADSGDAWNAGEAIQYRTGIGAEWNIEALLGYDLLHVNATLGYARGLDSGGESRLYFRAVLPLF